MPKVTLWQMELSPPANAVRVLAGMLGVEVELIDVDFLNLEHKSTKFLKMNPLGTLPVLKDEDFILTDSHAQMKYLVATYGGGHTEKLYPSDVKARAIIDQSLFLDAAVLFIRIKAVALPTIQENLKGPTERHINDVEAGYAVVEAYIGNNNFVAGENLTIADICVGSTIAASTSIHSLDQTKFPRTNDWLERMYQMPYFKKLIGPAVENLSHVYKSYWEKNKLL